MKCETFKIEELHAKCPFLRLGEIQITPLALEKLNVVDMMRGLVRHTFGDWGEVDKSQQRENNEHLEQGGRIVSKYKSLSSGTEFCIVTRADRSATRILLVSEVKES